MASIYTSPRSVSYTHLGLAEFKGNVLFSSYDHQFIQTVANRIIEIENGQILDKLMTYDEFLDFKDSLGK